MEGYIDRIIQKGNTVVPHVFLLKNNTKCLYNGFLPIREGDFIHCKGNFENGFFVCSSKPQAFISSSEDNIKKCFVLGIKGVGPKRAQRLYDFYKEMTKMLPYENLTESEKIEKYLDELSLYPYSGSGVLDLNEKVYGAFLSWWRKHRILRRLYLLGLNNKEIFASSYSLNELFEVCIRNPFRVLTISIEKARKICEDVGIEVKAEHIYCGTVIRKIDEFVRKGWTGVPEDKIKSFFPEIQKYEEILGNEYKFYKELGLCYNEYQYLCERKVSEFVNSSLQVVMECNYHNINKKLTDEQRSACEGAMSNKISIITGEGGTGKSHVIKEIYDNYNLLETQCILTSFTGKAVSRLQDIIGEKCCYTLDRLIGLMPGNIYNIIIDEASMVPLELVYKLLMRFGDKFRLILVGDDNQLPPISWGSFFSDILKSGKIPTFRLRKNFRILNEDNGILINARRLLRDESLEDYTNFYIQEGNHNLIYSMLERMRDKGVDYKRITIITPFNKEIPKFIQIYQKIFLENEPCYEDIKGKIWYKGDIVMQKVNNYEINIMNGEEGYVEEIVGDVLHVRYGNEIHKYFIEYPPDELTDEDLFKKKKLTVKELEHSFCKTVHKTQGSEYDIVIFYIPEYKSVGFLNKNLIYTGITRSKKRLWIIGDKETIKRGSVEKLPERYSRLTDRIK